MSDDLSKDMLARLNRLEMFAGHVADWAGNPLLHIKARAMLKATAQDVADAAQPDIGIPMTDPIAKRMEALVRRMAKVDPCSTAAMGNPSYDEARALAALLPDLPDPDREEAKRLYAAWGDDETCEDALYAAIKRGRELERASW